MFTANLFHRLRKSFVHAHVRIYMLQQSTDLHAHYFI